MKKIILISLLAVFALKAGTVTFAGKTLNTVTYDGKESVTLAEIAEKTSSRMVWVPEKKKAVLKYGGHDYVFTAANRTVVIGDAALHLPEPVGWDGDHLYVPVRMLERIFSIEPAKLEPPQDVKIEKIILSGSDPTTVKIMASGPISCEVVENSASRATLKLPVGSKVSQIKPTGLVTSASLKNNNDHTTIDLRLSSDYTVSTRGIRNGVQVSFASKPQVAKANPSGKVVVVDPGHGGKDPGAIGRNGTKEKDMTLDTGLRLKKLLESQGHTVYMTRTTDKYVALDARTKFANAKKADLFISIHYNANRSSSPHGFETYFLGMHRLEYAKNVALRENAALKYDMGENAYDPDDVLNDIIAALLTNKFQRQSQSLAGYVQDKGAASTGFSNRGVKQAGFYVLKGCSMPSVLVECGFLSNSTEEARIRKASYRQKIAQGITQGVASYLQGS